jgi:type II secretory pathway pseudopilin PulG
MRLNRPSSRGFTLLELGLVVGIITVLSAALLPSLLEAARGRMAARAGEEVKLLLEAGRWFYLNPPNLSSPMRWPGQVAGSCVQNQEPLQELINTGAVPRSAPDPANPAAAPTVRNPWNHPYVTSLTLPPNGGLVEGCVLRVSTWVAVNVAPAFKEAVEGACNEGADSPCGIQPATPPGEWRWCCAYAQQPSGPSMPGCVHPNRLVATGTSVACSP